MTVMIVGGIIVAAVLVACVVVLTRRGRTGSEHSALGTSSAELDAAARSASARASDRQGTGPF
jgi:hypothetical protein